MEKLIRVGHLRRYVRETVHGAEVASVVERITTSAELPPKPQPTINYILGGLVDDQYQSKSQKKRLLHATTVRARVNTIHIPDRSKAIQPIDGPISFPPVNPFKVITSHHGALILTLCINNFDVHSVLVDLGSATDLLQLLAFRHMNISFERLSSASRILSGFNGATIVNDGRNCSPCQGKAGSSTGLIFSCRGLGPVQCHCWPRLAACDESCALDLPSNDQLPDQCWANL